MAAVQRGEKEARPGVAREGPRHAELGVQRGQGQVSRRMTHLLIKKMIENDLKVGRYDKFDFLSVPLLRLYLALFTFHSNLSF